MERCFPNFTNIPGALLAEVWVTFDGTFGVSIPAAVFTNGTRARGPLVSSALA